MIKLTDSEFRYMAEYVQKNFGINLHKKRVLLEGRLNSYLVENGYSSFTDYMRAVERDRTGKELTNLLNKVTTNHTYFMREAEHFDYLRSVALPTLEKQIPNRDLRAWCAAASSGEEPYTLAMILHDYLGYRTPPWNKTLLATDISEKVLDIAKAGIYPKESVAKLPTAWVNKYFEPYDGTRMQVKPLLKQQVLYRQFNLMDRIVATRPYHVVFCRNVMIYFDMPTKVALAERIYDAMAPGGYLFIGFTESLPRPTRFQYLRPSIYQKGV